MPLSILPFYNIIYYRLYHLLDEDIVQNASLSQQRNHYIEH